jgi:REP element-mobilizing transposase RayT
MTYPRRLLVPPHAPGQYHCVSRCVRRAFLCGRDAYSGRCFEHRKRWVEERLFELAELFAVSIYGYAVMSNHLHVVLAIDPAAALTWSEAQVAERWLRLFPIQSEDAEVQARRLHALRSNPARLSQCRERLASLSWFMRCLNEPIARRANREDDCTGRFWEGRFKCQALLDERALLAAMAYVDLNPIRAGMTTRLDRSSHTSVARRMRALQRKPQHANARMNVIAGRTHSRGLSLSTAQYIELLDWTGRQLRPGKKGAIPQSAPAALRRLGIAPDRWTQHVRGVGSGYWRAIGSVQDLLDKAAAMGQHWLQGIRTARALA